MPTTYKIIRFQQDGDKKEIEGGLTLDEAQAHCRRDDTRGDGWFDGYEVDEEADEDLEQHERELAEAESREEDDAQEAEWNSDRW